MSVLPDHLAPNLRVVFCGTAASARSAYVRHYYAGPGNEFWPLLYASGILPVSLTPERDAEVLQYGVGLTDLAKKRSTASRDSDLAPGDFDVRALVLRIQSFAPAWLAFHGKTAAKIVKRSFGLGSEVSLGVQEWTVGGVRVYVVPSASAANRSSAHLEGKPTRLAWFQALAAELPKGPGVVNTSKR